jgi:hypothetical protein
LRFIGASDSGLRAAARARLAANQPAASDVPEFDMRRHEFCSSFGIETSRISRCDFNEQSNPSPRKVDMPAERFSCAPLAQYRIEAVADVRRFPGS